MNRSEGKKSCVKHHNFLLLILKTEINRHLVVNTYLSVLPQPLFYFMVFTLFTTSMEWVLVGNLHET